MAIPQTPKEIDLTNPSQNELSRALDAVIADTPPPSEPLDLVPNEFEQSIVCEPDQIEETQDFGDSEILKVACEPESIPREEVKNPIKSFPILPFEIDKRVTPVPVSDGGQGVIDDLVSNLKETLNSSLDPLGTTQRLSNNPLPIISEASLSTGVISSNQPTDSLFAQRNQTSPLFSSNGPDCYSAMKRMSDDIQKKVEEYTKAKEEIQKIQTEYFYSQLVGIFYKSLQEGYNEISSLNKLLQSSKNSTERAKVMAQIIAFRKTIPLNMTSKVAQGRVSNAFHKFSSQFIIDLTTSIDTPRVDVDTSIDIAGQIKDIPDNLTKSLSQTDAADPEAASEMIQKAKDGIKELDDAFETTLLQIKKLAFSYGATKFFRGEKISASFKSSAIVKKANGDTLKTKYDELKTKEQRAEDVINGLSNTINEELGVMGCKMKDTIPTMEAGTNTNYKNVSTNPTIFDYAWWKKFSKLASIVNLVPLHWPVGLLIPTPAMLVKVPFPIIWIPLFVVGTEKSISVLFIGQCGILPCPFLFTQHFLDFPVGPFLSNNPYFVVAIRGPINISSHSSLFTPAFPSFDPLNILMNAALAALRSGGTINLGELQMKAKESLSASLISANTYAESVKKQMNDKINNAQKTGDEIVKKAQDAATKEIEMIEKEGKKIIDEQERKYQEERSKLSDQSIDKLKEIDNKYSATISNIKKDYVEKRNASLNKIEEAKKQSKELVQNAKKSADAIKKNADAELKSLEKKAKEEYSQKVKDIEKVYKDYDKNLDNLRSLINMIKVPTIDLTSTSISGLLNGFINTLGSVEPLSAKLSPKIEHFNFMAEVNPTLSQLLPLAVDEFPTWERLSLSNVPFLLFLWKWCSAGKEKGGFFRDPF